MQRGGRRGVRNQRGMTLFETAILLLVLVLVVITSIFVAGRINHDRAQSQQNLNGVDRLF